MIKHLITLTALALYTTSAHASFISYFKEDGDTNWQYVANFSSSVLIILLSITAITLFFSRRRTKRANRALREIREALEQRVQERTATLAQSKEKLEASETYIKNILASMPSMLIGLDRDLNITQWNLCAEETTGINHNNALGKNLWKAYPSITLSPQQIENGPSQME